MAEKKKKKKDPFANLPTYSTKDVIPNEVLVMKLQSDDSIYIRGRMNLGINTRFVEIMANKKPSKFLEIPSIEDVGLADGCAVYTSRIPFELLEKVESFFVDVYREYISEAVVLLLYNPTHDRWIVIAPPQEVSLGSADYTWPDEAPPKGWYYAGTIHSHSDFSAFHSGTDDKDEKNFDGVHITLGGVKKGHRDAFNRSASASIMIDGIRFLVPMNSLVEEPVRPDYEDYWMSQVSEAPAYEDVHLPPDNFEFNTEEEDFTDDEYPFQY